ncbi:Fic family protein [Stenotrophomonas indicatrix]
MKDGLFGVPMAMVPPIFAPKRPLCRQISVACASHCFGQKLPSVKMEREEVIALLAEIIPCKISDPDASGGFRRVSLPFDVVNNRLYVFLSGVRRIFISDVFEVHKCILELSGRPMQRSTFRRAELLVGVNSINAHGFVAPLGNFRVEMDWLLDEVRSSEGVVEMLSAFLWYFLHLHPFHDGNGRVSRFVALMLVSSRWGVDSLEFSAALRFLLAAEHSKSDFIHAMYRARGGSFSEFGEFLVSNMFGSQQRCEFSRKPDCPIEQSP